MLWSGPELKPRSSGFTSQAHSISMPLSSSPFPPNPPPHICLWLPLPLGQGPGLRLVGLRQGPNFECGRRRGVDVPEISWVQLIDLLCHACEYMQTCTCHGLRCRVKVISPYIKSKSTALKISYLDQHSKTVLHRSIHHSLATVVFWT